MESKRIWLHPIGSKRGADSKWNSRGAMAITISGESLVDKEQSQARIEPRTEPRWPALLAVLAVGLLFYAVPESLTVGPGWLVFAIVGILMIPAWLFHLAGRS